MYKREKNNRLILIILVFILLRYNFGFAQKISLAAVTELRCEQMVGSIRVALSNRGKDPLRLLSLQSSSPYIKVSTKATILKPGNMTYLLIEYDLRNIPQQQALSIVIQTNDYKQPKTTLLLTRSQ